MKNKLSLPDDDIPTLKAKLAKLGALKIPVEPVFTVNGKPVAKIYGSP